MKNVCENKFCMYQSKGHCTNDEIYLNEQGVCQDCIFAQVDEQILQPQKEAHLKKMREFED